MSEELSAFHAELSHTFIHNQMNEIIADGLMDQYYPIIISSLEEKKCDTCCNLIIDNYPAVELWMQWIGFNECEEKVFTKAIQLSTPTAIFYEFERSTEHWPLLFRAVSNNHVTFVKEIIEKCPKVLVQICDGDNVFKFALVLGRNDIVHYLFGILSEDKFNKYLKLGVEEFITACNRSECSLEIIKRLLDLVLTRKENDWKNGLIQALRMMIFKHLDELPALLSYFCETYSSEIPILYEQTESGEVLIFSITVDYLSVAKILEYTEKAIDAKDKDGKTLLMRAIEVQNVALVKFLLSKHRIDVNGSDNSNKTALDYAMHQGNPFIIQLLIENGAKIPNTFTPYDKIESHVIRYDPDEIMSFAISTLQGDISLEMFANVIKCLYESSPGSHWPWFSSPCTRKLFFPSPTNDKSANDEIIRRFKEIYKILYKVKITEKCSNVFDIIFFDRDVTYEEKQFACLPKGLLEIQMSLIHEDPALEFACEEMYETKEFELIKDFISIETFNEIAGGREIVSLKRHCREVIRQRIICQTMRKRLYNVDEFDQVFTNIFDSLPIPQQLCNFLRYQS